MELKEAILRISSAGDQNYMMAGGNPNTDVVWPIYYRIPFSRPSETVPNPSWAFQKMGLTL